MLHNGAFATLYAGENKRIANFEEYTMRKPEDSPRWSRKYLINENLKGGFKGGILNFHSALLMPALNRKKE